MGNKYRNPGGLYQKKEREPPKFIEFIEALRARYTQEELKQWDVTTETDRYVAEIKAGWRRLTRATTEEQLQRAMKVISIPIEEVPVYIGDDYVLVRSLAIWRLDIGK